MIKFLKKVDCITDKVSFLTEYLGLWCVIKHIGWHNAGTSARLYTPNQWPVKSDHKRASGNRTHSLSLTFVVFRNF